MQERQIGRSWSLQGQSSGESKHLCTAIVTERTEAPWEDSLLHGQVTELFRSQKALDEKQSSYTPSFSELERPTWEIRLDKTHPEKLPLIDSACFCVRRNLNRAERVEHPKRTKGSPSRSAHGGLPTFPSQPQAINIMTEMHNALLSMPSPRASPAQAQTQTR
jgi:hypothetical protein